MRRIDSMRKMAADYFGADDRKAAKAEKGLARMLGELCSPHFAREGLADISIDFERSGEDELKIAGLHFMRDCPVERSMPWEGTISLDSGGVHHLGIRCESGDRELAEKIREEILAYLDASEEKAAKGQKGGCPRP